MVGILIDRKIKLIIIFHWRDIFCICNRRSALC